MSRQSMKIAACSDVSAESKGGTAAERAERCEISEKRNDAMLKDESMK